MINQFDSTVVCQTAFSVWKECQECLLRRQSQCPYHLIKELNYLSFVELVLPAELRIQRDEEVSRLPLEPEQGHCHVDRLFGLVWSLVRRNRLQSLHDRQVNSTGNAKCLLNWPKDALVCDLLERFDV